MGDELQISARVRVGPGDPVRVYRKQGLFRFVRTYTRDGVTYADIVGPIGGRELYRTVRADLLRSAGRATRSDVTSSPAVLALSRSAHERRR